ncbi:hypothetical protein ACJ73_04048 [Blastomyces percursus]|uniref:Uncharacterized protein n=1 Tax=Blastomyces percursus TaxID=1658174 RepID=A0A1J9Q7T7_9EURO|nr:hypothetical protein ACJ73_04048 [Blastomyces percursus]
MSRKQRHNQLADFEETETSEPSGREPWAYSPEYRRIRCYPQTQQPAAQVEKRPVRQGIAEHSPDVPRTVDTSHRVYSGQQNDERSQYRDAAVAARELNINAQDQREVGTRGMENSLKPQNRSQSSNTEIPHKNVQYHLSSKRGNPPSPVPLCSSDGSGYNSRISNPQLVYRSGYPANDDNNHSSPPAFASLPHQNTNLLGYSNSPAEPANPPKSSTSLPARSEQNHPPMNQGDALHPHIGALASCLVPPEKGNVVEVKHSEETVTNEPKAIM